MSGAKTLTKDDREWIVEHAVEFATSADPIVADSARAILRYERTLMMMDRAVNAACALIELGDERLLASDGPAGGQPPDLTLSEWRQLYVGLDAARNLSYVRHKSRPFAKATSRRAVSPTETASAASTPETYPESIRAPYYAASRKAFDGYRTPATPPDEGPTNG